MRTHFEIQHWLVAAIIAAMLILPATTPAFAQETDLTEPAYTEVVTKGSNVRSDPSTNNPAIAKVPAGIKLSVNGCAGTWASVVAANGDAGFIAGYLLNPNPCPEVAWGGAAAPATGSGWGGVAAAPAAAPTSAPASSPVVQQGTAPTACSFATPGDENTMPKVEIEKAPASGWFHRVFNPALFDAAHGWGGADSWMFTYALGPNSGGKWMDHNNPGQIVYRGESTSLSWCLGVLTNSAHKAEFLAGAADQPLAINVRIAPNSNVTVVTASGKTLVQPTSDMGDITVIVPDDGVIVISVSYTTAAPTHESLVWVGPYDRSESINTVDAR